MKTIPLILSFALILIFQPLTYAQQTAYYTQLEQDVAVAKQLYQQNKFVSAFREFEKIQKKVEEKSEFYSEAEFFKAASALHAGYRSGDKMMDNFIATYPESPYINTAWFEIGKVQFEKRQYAKVIRSFQNVDRAELSENDRIELQYQNGYSNLVEENNNAALAEFEAVRNTNNLYSKPAGYYWAHIQYLNENYDAALQGFSALNNDPAYSQVIPIYVSHIYYKQGKYSEVVNYTVPILDEVETEHKTELSRIIGDSYFHLKEYNKAIPYLETYFETSAPKTREENYILGFCYYQTGKYADAAPLLEKAATGEDELTQNACYHLADCYIRLDQKEKAKTAFNAASEFDFNPKIKEDALFSYAKLTYELSYSPFNETINAFDRYISEYPNSDRNAEAYRILVDVYMVTRNYKDAIESIEKIRNKTPDVLKAYQRVTFYRGLELFNAGDFEQAIEYFNLSLDNGKYSRDINARALYWKSEALYRSGDYNAAILAYNRFEQTPGATATSESGTANYNLGYAYLKMNDEEAAFRQFSQFVSKSSGSDQPKKADAYNRLGDYYFQKAKYDQAVENYQQAYNMRIFDADYALLQIAFCQGLQRKHQEKIDNLNRLLSDFPQSEYADDALYELGRANERLGKNPDAVQQYQKLVATYPESSYYRKALLQLGLINYNNGDYNKALQQYKDVAENYRGTPEAESALSGIKNCYVELNNVDEYFAYINRLGGGATVSATEQDQLTYMAAERLYMDGKAEAGTQLRHYLEQFPNGAYLLNAHFYLAELLYKDGVYQEANEHYTWVANQPDNLFSEPALSKASEMQFNAENYEVALNMFNRLEKVSNSKWNILKANVGQMRCYMRAKQFQQAIEAARKVKKQDVTSDALKYEADYAIGKSNYELGNLSSSIDPLNDVAKNTQLEQGAEAKYLLAEIHYKNKNLAKSEETIIDFVEKGTPYTYWLGKAFLLLSNIYEDKGDQFQAKHTLKSLAENYNEDDDGIKAEANRRLTAIQKKEARQQQNAVDSSFQMEIKQK
ncbi:tetratricopeptide repeat protein [Maribellus sp. YY47]|uniref:tetratricopeptide repeat protein n=1 Tax=Maribellus sp. YY47 TaxID=2929486 RepID=UPI002000A651|nr:tetratricopeptide repeat protein [Maribellus sp. YY47]MCK3685245.1 tetratricopeptide repeat protein [Maribellus sp. YY47]